LAFEAMEPERIIAYIGNDLEFFRVFLSGKKVNSFEDSFLLLNKQK
jgi:hypothetical protein